MDQPNISGTSPIQITLEPGNYAWCSCGLSTTPPFCNGAHRGTTLRPTIIKITDQAETLYLCECKQTKNPPYCDGSHQSL